MSQAWRDDDPDRLIPGARALVAKANEFLDDARAKLAKLDEDRAHYRKAFDEERADVQGMKKGFIGRWLGWGRK